MTEISAIDQPRDMSSHKVSSAASRGIRVLFLLSCAVMFGIPLLWLFFAATKTQSQLTSSNPFSFGSLGHLVKAWDELLTFNNGEIVRWIVNSAIYSVTTVVIVLILCIPAGYALAKLDFRLRRVILLVTLVSMVVPAVALVLPLYLEMNAVHLVGSALSVILPQSLYPFGVYLAYIYFSLNLPRGLIESARLDGAGEAKTFFNIALPLAKPVVGLMVPSLSVYRTG